MRAPTATPTSRGAPGASLRRGASARASRVGASSARRPVAARAAAFAPRRAPARVPGLAPARPTRAAARRSRTAEKLKIRAAATATPNGPNGSSADAVNNGLACFESRQYEDAVVNFTAALNDFGVPSEDESRAALYNRACASCKLRRFDSAKADLTSAVNEYGLKFSVVLKDSDMEVFRGTPQYEEMADEVKGFRSGASIAKLKAEAQEPFRFFKLYAFGGLGAGAFVGLIIILTRLSAAVAGGEGAPDLGETIGNLLVNLVAITVFAVLFKGESEQSAATQQKVAREEEFGRLRLSLAEDAEDATVSRLRGNYRLFLVAGSEAHIDTVVAGLSKYKTLLKEKNVVIATLDMAGDGGGARDSAAKETETATETETERGAGVAALAAEFAAAREQSAGDDTAAPAAPALEFGKRSRKAKPGKARAFAGGASTPTERKWRVAPAGTETWRAWVVNEIERSGFDPTVRDVFFSVGKDGTLWKSGAGTPNWMKLIEELPDGGWTGGV